MEARDLTPREREWIAVLRALDARDALPVVGVLKEVRFYHDGRQVCVATEARSVPSATRAPR